MIVHEQEQAGALAAGSARMRHPRTDQHVAHPQLVGTIGLVPSVRHRLRGELRSLQAALGQLLADGARCQPHAVTRRDDVGDVRRAARGQLDAQRGSQVEELGMATHRAGVGTLLGSQAVEPVLAVRAQPAVDGAAGDAHPAAVGMAMGARRQGAHDVAAFARPEAAVGRLRDHREAEQGDGLGVDAHGRHSSQGC